MVEQPQAMENNTAKEHEDKQKNRTRATFSLLDHFLRVYNNSETYIKRGLTLFGLGSVIAGASFGVGQRLPNNEATLPQQYSDSPASSLSSTSTSQQPVNPTPQPNSSQPQIIYVTPPSTQSIIVPHPEPTKTLTSIESQPEPVVIPLPSTSKTSSTAQQPEPVETPSPVNSLPVPEKVSQVKQTVDSVQQISGALADIKQDLNPLFGGGDD